MAAAWLPSSDDATVAMRGRQPSLSPSFFIPAAPDAAATAAFLNMA